MGAGPAALVRLGAPPADRKDQPATTMFSMSLGRLNKVATLAILPGMVLVIMLFSGAARQESDDVVSPASGTLVVANLRSETLTLFNVATGRASTLALPGPPHEMVEFDGRLYITLGRADLLLEVDPRVPAVVRTLRISGEPHGIAIHDGRLAITLDQDDALVFVDPATLQGRPGPGTGDTPHVIASNGADLFVTDTRDNAVRLLGEPPVVQPTGELPEALAVTGEYVVVANYGSGTLSVFDSATLGQVTTVEIGAGPVRVLALDEGRVAVARQGSPEVVIVAVPTGKILERFDAPDRPDGLCLSADGAHLAVAGNGGRSVAIFDTASWKQAAVVNAGDGPGSCLWLAGR